MFGWWFSPRANPFQIHSQIKPTYRHTNAYIKHIMIHQAVWNYIICNLCDLIQIRHAVAGLHTSPFAIHDMPGFAGVAESQGPTLQPSPRQQTRMFGPSSSRNGHAVDRVNEVKSWVPVHLMKILTVEVVEYAWICSMAITHLKGFVDSFEFLRLRQSSKTRTVPKKDA